MKNLIILLSVVFPFVSFANGEATGLRCISQDGYVVEVIQVSRAVGKKWAPSVFQVKDQSGEFLLIEKTQQIKKHTTGSTVRFVTLGNEVIMADSVTLAVFHDDETEELKEGRAVSGQMILLQDDDYEVFEVTCKQADDLLLK